MSQPRERSRLITRLVVAAGLVALVIAMVLNTKFLTPEEVEALTPEEFDPQATAQELYSTAQSELTQNPSELSELAAALDEDPEAAAEEYDALSPSEGVVAYAVTARGTVADASAENLSLAVDGIDEGRQIVIPLTTALDGNLIRDISDFSFGDAPGQTDYQRVGTEINSMMRADMQESVGEDPESLIGEEITVHGVLRYMTTDAEGPDERPLVIQPLSLEAGA